MKRRLSSPGGEIAAAQTIDEVAESALDVAEHRRGVRLPPMERALGKMLRTPLPNRLIIPVGSRVEVCESIRAEGIRAGIWDAATTRGQCKLPLRFLEELSRDGVNLARRERDTESSKHHDMIHCVAQVLLRVGFAVYPGGVSVPGCKVFADLLAIDENGSPLFVEVLTQSNIKRGAVQHKLALAERVPFCFVGKVPPNIPLPSGAYAVEVPTAARTIHGAWVPPFLRRRDSESPRLIVRAHRARKNVSGNIALPGLRLAEDVSGILWSALRAALCHLPSGDVMAYDTPKMGQWAFGRYFPRDGVPFAARHRRASVFTMKSEKDSFRLDLAADNEHWVTFEAKGTCEGFEHCLERIREVGLPVEVEWT